ncbi:Low temperature viability protein-domain-containing protein [Sparassis latifolia]
MPPKSIFRQPEAQHFQLVHRSQRDPLIHDPEASQHVLKAFERRNLAKGKSRADLEGVITPSALAHDNERANIGQAALYGVYFDDTEYDYMQHLRTFGLQEDGVDSILIEAPAKPKAKGKATDLFDLPAEALPSTSELPRTYESQQAIPSSIAGFQPDMDPHLRQALEALEDDDFIEDDLDDDFFGELVQKGERGTDEHVDFAFREDGFTDGEQEKSTPGTEQTKGTDDEDPSWEARFAQFKKNQKATSRNGTSDVDAYSEGGDTVGTLPLLSVIGGKRRRKGTSDASGFSMSSSSMFRNEGLTLLDERFDQAKYESDEEDEDGVDSDDSDEAPELITSREDFDSLMSEFLDNYEILGGKMRPVLPGGTGMEKLDSIRKGLGTITLRVQDENNSEDEILMPLDVDDKKDRWDCETILTTYSNLENHPRLIRASRDKAVPKIRLDPRTGLPIVKENHPQSPDDNAQSGTSWVSDDEDDTRPTRVTVTRSRNESKEDKKLRKQAVKTKRQARRADKKATTEKFTTEASRQARMLVNKEKTKMRKL